MNDKPICVDLDGTLIKTDSLIESALLLLMKNPFYIFLMIYWYIKGKHILKKNISEIVYLEPANLPYNDELIVFLTEMKNNGRDIWLCTAANKRIANSIAEHINIFSKVLASDDNVNLSSSKKADEILKHTKSFDYAGNSKDDINVWKHADNAILVNLPSKLKSKVTSNITYEIENKKNKIKLWLKELRVHQWAKNLLIFVPVIAAHSSNIYAQLLDCIIAFLSFGFCASSVYLINDLVDLKSDRIHKTKRNRPLASGDLSLIQGCFAAVSLLTLSILIALFLPFNFIITLFLYYIITLTYSFYFKKKIVIDVTMLAILYSMRVIAGGAATGIVLSNWLITFSMFIFFSLATVKRVAELKQSSHSDKISGRGYYPSDLPIILVAGVSSGYISILVFSLYIDSFSSIPKYTHLEALYFISLILFMWLTRVWLLTWRGEMNDDPVAFALKDKTSRIMGLLVLAIFIFSAWG